MGARKRACWVRFGVAQLVADVDAFPWYSFLVSWSYWELSCDLEGRNEHACEGPLSQL